MKNALLMFVVLFLHTSAMAAQFQLPPAATPTPKLIKAGRILDVKSGQYLLNQGIWTEGERIKEVGPWEKVRDDAPKDATLIDLSRATVLPGLIDCHAHLLVSMDPHLSGGQAITTAIALMSPEFRTLRIASNLRPSEPALQTTPS